MLDAFPTQTQVTVLVSGLELIQLLVVIFLSIVLLYYVAKVLIHYIRIKPLLKFVNIYLCKLGIYISLYF